MDYKGPEANGFTDPHEVREYHPLITRKGYKENSFTDPAADRVKLASLIRSFRRDTYSGPPVLLLNEQALTGTHRIYAARRVKAELPVFQVTTDSDIHDAIMSDIHDAGHYEDIPNVLRKHGFHDAACVMDYDVH